MSRTYFALLVMIAALLSCNSEDQSKCINSEEGHIIDGIYYYKGYPYSGCVERNDGVEPRAIFPLENGILNGKYIEYYPDNRPLLTQEYVDGKKHGLYVIYWENGMVSDSFMYVNDSPDGEILGYYDDGSERSWDFYSIGKSEGPSIYFLDSLKRTFFWGERDANMNVGGWHYKFTEDSCFIRTFLEDNESYDTPCSCDELDYPPRDNW